MASVLRRLRHRVELNSLRALAWSVTKMPRSWLPPAARALGAVACALDVFGRPVAEENLRFALGPAVRPDVASRLARESYQSLALNFLQLFWSENITAENYREHCEVVFEDPDTLQAARENPVILLTPHYQNFELSSIVTGLAVRPLFIVAQDFHNELLTGFFADYRCHASHEVISSEGALLKLFRSLSHGGGTGLLVDLASFPDTNTVPVQCFGHPVCVSQLPEELSRRTNAVIVPVLSTALPDGRTRVRYMPHFHVGDLSNPEAAQRIWDCFEPAIRAEPVGWLWMYKQWRYRPRRATNAYPGYAYQRRRFDVITNDASSWNARVERLKRMQSREKRKAQAKKLSPVS